MRTAGCSLRAGGALPAPGFARRPVQPPPRLLAAAAAWRTAPPAAAAAAAGARLVAARSSSSDAAPAAAEDAAAPVAAAAPAPAPDAPAPPADLPAALPAAWLAFMGALFDRGYFSEEGGGGGTKLERCARGPGARAASGAKALGPCTHPARARRVRDAARRPTSPPLRPAPAASSPSRASAT